MENELAYWIGHGMEVRLDVEVLDYVDGRPSTFGISYEVIDPKTNTLVYDNADRFVNGPGQTFERFKQAEMANKIAKANGAI